MAKFACRCVHKPFASESLESTKYGLQETIPIMTDNKVRDAHAKFKIPEKQKCRRSLLRLRPLATKPSVTIMHVMTMV